MADIARKELRLSRYSQLRQQGFSPTEARRLRDWKGERITTEVTRVERRISRVRVAERTEAQTTRIEAIRDFRSRGRRDPDSFIPIDSRPARVARFAAWSGTRKFPRGLQIRVLGRTIAQINVDAGLDPLDGFGYRLFYHRYVNGVSEIEARQRAETRDS